MPNKSDRPTDPAHALYHDALCGNVEAVQKAITETPELVRGKPVVDGAWSHGGRRCAAEDDVITCLQLLVGAGADLSLLSANTFDSALKVFPRGAAFLFRHGADARTADGDGTTGLHAMAKIGNRSAAKLLLSRGADINAKSNDGETPLDVAVQCTQVYNSARCCPSRASLMTGLYPSQAGIGDFTTNKPSKTRGPGYLGRLNDNCATMAEVLEPAGYGCYYVGKWHMHPDTGPIKRGFDEFYGYTRDHSHDQYDADYYIRLPEGRAKEIAPPADEYYATDVFNNYAVEFIKQGQKSEKPFFLFLGHSSPHFPVQAPAERADKYEATYMRGWDVLREERYARMHKIGLVDGKHWKMSPREIVPVDRDDIANGFSGKQNPAWDSLNKDRQRDLARRMAVFAAMVEGVDHGVGQIVDHLKDTGDFENTLILFLSDNGACYEWGPFGFDGTSRRGETILRRGDDLRNIGGRGTHQSYGSAWANLGNTPFRLYKHFTHEGGISTPFIAHWPEGIAKREGWVRDPRHMMDVLPTLMEVAVSDVASATDASDEPGSPLQPNAGAACGSRSGQVISDRGA